MENIYFGKNRIFSFSLTIKLIFLNIFLFILFSLLISFNILTQNQVGLTPNNIIHGKNLWTIVTSMFMHANVLHLVFNMFSLFFIGVFVEKLIGKKRFLWFYILSGIFAGLFFALLSGFFGSNYFGEKLFGNPEISGVGASGALFGLLGILAMIIPHSKVYLIIGPLIAIILETILQNVLNQDLFIIFNIVINIYFILSVIAIFSFNEKIRKIALPVEMPLWLLPIIAIIPLIIIGLFVSLPIGNMAHLGGLIIGLAYGFYLKKKYKKKVKLLGKYFN